jgi:DNA processing protein
VVLYWFGSRDAFINAQALAIIGSRNANAYGARAIKAFVPPLVDVGFTIVSGGALGADSMAHRETINANGITVAVLGSGLSRLYPRTNVKLFEEIIAIGGAVVSSFPMTMESLPENFPARNRIIAGLSRGCIVVQAAAKSGTRITADYALQQGREVFVVPGCFDDPLSAGCHALAHDGATMVTSATDVLAELGITAAQQESVQSTVVTEQQAITSVQHELTIADKIIVATRMPATVDEVAAQLNLEYDVVQQQLWDLQWRGMVHQDFTGRWVHN